MRYSDNIFKGFATSISVAISCVIDSYLFDDTILNETFCRGSLVVFLSSSAYIFITSHKIPPTTNASKDYDKLQSTEDISKSLSFII